MASITIRNIDDSLKERLRVRAAQQGRSMEEEARVILRDVVGAVTGPALWELSRQLFAGEHGVDLDPPARGDDRQAPGLDEPEPLR